MAAYLGLDMKHDRTYLWIAEEALYADLPGELVGTRLQPLSN